jgi:hypothetical protein
LGPFREGWAPVETVANALRALRERLGSHFQCLKTPFRRLETTSESLREVSEALGTVTEALREGFEGLETSAEALRESSEEPGAATDALEGRCENLLPRLEALAWLFQPDRRLVYFEVDRLHGSRQGADSQNLVGSEAFNIRLPDRHDGDRLPEGIEYLQDTARLSSFGVEDRVDKDGDVPPPEIMLGEIALEGDTLIERQAHDLFSFQGFIVTNRTRPSCRDCSQIVTTVKVRPFGPVNPPSARRKTPYSLLLSSMASAVAASSRIAARSR